MIKFAACLLGFAALSAAGLAGAATVSDDGLWRTVDESSLAPAAPGRDIVPSRYRALALDVDALRARLAAAPQERSGAAALEITLPLPDGSFVRARVEESTIMEPELQAKFPEIRTYAAQGLDQPRVSGRLDLTPAGFHAQLFTPQGRVFVDPYRRGDTGHYVVYFTRDYPRPADGGFECGVAQERARAADELGSQPAPATLAPTTPSGPTLRTYRLALAGTGEYTTAVCAPNPAAVACGLAAMVTSMNRVGGIYEREVAIRMVLVANNNLVVYTNGATDPYSNGNGTTMLSQNQSNLDSVIGTANYDIGHVFSTGGGGVASLAVPCRAGVKARGVTGRGSPVGDPFDVDYVAHEMGHQWGADHTFNGTTSSCGGGNRSDEHAYEPGSGSTIMAYAGICGAEDLQPNSDPFFHTDSFDAIVDYSTTGQGNACAVATATGNSAPTVNPGPAFTIPSRTPFTLTGSATDPNGDTLDYSWEEFDRGAAAPPNTDNGNRAIFRSFDPTAAPSRTFPKLSDILNNVSTIGESLPTTTRSMTFRLTARDERLGGGGVDRASTTVNVVGTAGPFQVTAPNTNVTWAISSTQNVTWNVASTNVAPINCANVKISLSRDGGLTFPETLLASTPNDGSEGVTVPSPGTTQARVKVECVGNIFFDVSNVNFAIDITPVELQGFQVE